MPSLETATNWYCISEIEKPGYESMSPGSTQVKTLKALMVMGIVDLAGQVVMIDLTYWHLL